MYFDTQYSFKKFDCFLKNISSTRQMDFNKEIKQFDFLNSDKITNKCLFKTSKCNKSSKTRYIQSEPKDKYFKKEIFMKKNIYESLPNQKKFFSLKNTISHNKRFIKRFLDPKHLIQQNSQ